jgi:hypothetical protein
VIIGLGMLVAALGATGAHADDPTLHQIYQAAENGRVADAQAMMEQVLRDHPDSAKAHFVEAELMARQGRLADARGELAKAEKLAPGLPFAKAQSVNALQARLSGTNERAQPAAAFRPVGRSGLPSGSLLLGIGLFAVILLAFRFWLGRNGVTRAGCGPVQPNAGTGTTPMSPAGGMGSGLLGGLATGAAVGAGMIAGEELMHRFLEGNSGIAGAIPPANADDPFLAQDDLGGQDFGIGDGSWDDGSGLSGDDWS